MLGLADADRLHVWLDILHGVIDRHSGTDLTTRTVYIEINILIRLIRFQKQQLGDNQVGHMIFNGASYKNDSVFEQA